MPLVFIAKQVGSTAEQIASLKDELKEAQRIRNNKLEYDVVAREIMQLEERSTYHEYDCPYYWYQQLYLIVIS